MKQLMNHRVHVIAGPQPGVDFDYPIRMADTPGGMPAFIRPLNAESAFYYLPRSHNRNTSSDN